MSRTFCRRLVRILSIGTGMAVLIVGSAILTTVIDSVFLDTFVYLLLGMVGGFYGYRWMDRK